MPVRHGGLSSLDAGRRSVNRGAEELAGSIAIPKIAEGSKRENDGFVRPGVDVIFHLDVLKPPLPSEMYPTVLPAQTRRNRCRWSLTIGGDVDASAYHDSYRGAALCRSGSSHEKEQGK